VPHKTLVFRRQLKTHYFSLAFNVFLIRCFTDSWNASAFTTDNHLARRLCWSAFVCPEHNSKTNVSKVFKLGIWNDLGIP